MRTRAARAARTSAHSRSDCRPPGRAAKSCPGTTNASGAPPSKASVILHAVVAAHFVRHRTTVLSSRVRSTGATSWRCNSASSRLASETSVISRSSRLTSCSMTASSRARLSGGLGQRHGLDRRAQRGERILQFMRHVRREALDRLDAAVERVGHLAQRAGQFADLVAPVGEVGNLDARLDAPPHASRRASASRRTGPAMVRASSIESSTMTAPSARNSGRPAAARPRPRVDLAAFGREQQRAAHRAEALDRHRDQHDDLAALVDAHRADFRPLSACTTSG